MVLQDGLEVEERVGRAGPVLVDPPVVELADRDCVQVVVLLPADAAGGHETRRLEDPQVLHHAEPRHRRQRPLELRERLAITLEEPIEQPPPADVRHGVEHLVVHADEVM